jgi:predicted nucleotidyltransferase
LLPISDLLCFALEALISTVIPALDYQIQGQASTENARRYAGKYDEHPPPGASITRSTKKHPGHPSTPQNPMKPFTYTLTAQQKAEICDQTQTHLAACPEIAFAYIHGSFTEDMAQIHDIDVGVYFNTTQTADLEDIAARLERELTLKTGITFDLKVLNHAPITFTYHVMRGELINNADDDTRCHVMEHVLRQYFDIRLILRNAIKEAFSV